MAAPIDKPLSTSPVRMPGVRPENATPTKPRPGEMPFTRSEASGPPALPVKPSAGDKPVNVDVNGFPTHLLFTTSGGQEIKIRRASQMEQPTPQPAGSEATGGDETKPA